MTEEQYDLIYGAGAAKALANSQSWSNRGTTPARLKEISNMNWKEANALEKTQAFDRTYKGKDAVSKSNYIKQGLQSLFGKYTPGSNVGGGTALTQKIFQNPVLKSLINNPVAKTAARTANFLGTPALAYGVGDLTYNLTDKAINTNFADSVGLGINDFKGYGSNLFNFINPTADTNYNTGQTSIFNRGNINVEDYTTKKNRVLAERKAEQQRIAEQQRVNPVAGIPQSEYQTKMNDVYKNVVVDNAGNTGYTGTGNQGRGAYFQTPAYRGQQAAASVDRKAKNMGVASPVRRTPGTKYGFGL